MKASVYQINKGINRPLEFRGLKAQYIWYLCGGCLALLILFAVIYVTGFPTFVCLAVVGILARSLTTRPARLAAAVAAVTALLGADLPYHSVILVAMLAGMAAGAPRRRA